MTGRKSKYDGKTKKKIKEVRFRSRQDGSLIPYIEFFEDSDIRLPIKSIIIGPHPNQPAQRAALELLLEQLGIEVEIRTADQPFREPVG